MQFIKELALGGALDGAVLRSESRPQTGQVTLIDTGEVVEIEPVSVAEVIIEIPDAAALFPNVVVVGGQVVLDANNGYRLTEFLDIAPSYVRLRRVAGRLEIARPSGSMSIAEGCYMVASPNYSSFLLGELPRLERYAEHIAQGVPLILHGSVRSFHRDLLTMAGVEASQVLEVAEDVEVLAGRLIHASPTFMHQNTTVSAMQFLRGKLAKLVQAGGGGRFYFSRSRLGENSDRRIVNEAQLEEFLESKAIEIVHPQTLTARQQLGKFANADLIVAPFGAMWANAVVRKSASRSLMLTTKFTPEFARLLISNGNDLDLLRLPPRGQRDGRSFSRPCDL